MSNGEKKEEVLTTLVQGLKLQRHEAEKRAGSAERKLEDSESRLAALESAAKQVSAKQIAAKSPPADVVTGFKEAKQIERQRVLKQRKKDDQHRRQKHHKQRVLQEARTEAQKEYERQMEQAQAEIGQLQSRAKAQAKAQRTAAVRERVQIVQAAQAEAEELVRQQVEVAEELVRQQAEALTRDQDSRVVASSTTSHLLASEENSIAAFKVQETSTMTSATTEEVLQQCQEQINNADCKAPQVRGSDGEKREEVLAALVQGLKLQRHEAEKRAVSAERKLEESESRQAEQHPGKPPAAAKRPAASVLKEAKQIERQRVLKQRKVDDQHRRQAQHKRRVFDEAHTEAQNEYEKQMELARAEIAQMKSQAKVEAKAQVKVQRTAAIRESAQIVQVARVQAEALSRQESDQNSQVVESSLTPPQLLADENSIPTVEVQESPAALTDNSTLVKNDVEVEDHIVDVAQWEILPDLESTVEDSWDIIG